MLIKTVPLCRSWSSLTGKFPQTQKVRWARLEQPLHVTVRARGTRQTGGLLGPGDSGPTPPLGPSSGGPGEAGVLLTAGWGIRKLQKWEKPLISYRSKGRKWRLRSQSDYSKWDSKLSLRPGVFSNFYLFLEP